MQDELHALQPQLIITSEKTEKLMIKIEQDTVVVEAKKEIVGADEALANEAAAAAQAIKDDCESDLSEAIPALEAAVEALNTLKPADITVVKSMKNPPSGVKLVLESICVMKQIKPERKPDPSGSGKMMEDYWGPSLKLLGDLKFLDSLRTYDKDNIPPPVMKRIRERFVQTSFSILRSRVLDLLDYLWSSDSYPIETSIPTTSNKFPQLARAYANGFVQWRYTIAS